MHRTPDHKPVPSGTQDEREREIPKCHVGPYYKNEVIFADGIIAVVGRSVVPADCKRASDIVQALSLLYAERKRVQELEGALKSGGWVISDGQDRTFRTMIDGGISWDTLENAIRFARREDAEQFAADDEEAWHIRTFAEAERVLLSKEQK